MKVFSACLKVMRGNCSALLVYMVVFGALCVVLSSFSSGDTMSSFTAERPNFSIVDRDNTELTKGLKTFLEQSGEHVEVKDEASAMQDASFFGATSFLLIVPEGFTAALDSSAPIELEKVRMLDDTRGFYMEQRVDQYLNTVARYHAMLPESSMSELLAYTAEDLSKETKVELRQYGEKALVSVKYQSFMRIYSYISLALISLCITSVLMVFHRPDLNMRNLCAPTKPTSRALQMTLACGLLSAIIMVFFFVIGWVFMGDGNENADPRALGLIALNAGSITLVASGLGFLMSQLVQNEDGQNAAVNLVSLGFSALGGAFVPLTMFGETMRVVAHFTPTYWYITALETICMQSDFSAEALNPIFIDIGVQVLFAAAFFCVALAVSRAARQSEKGFARVRTELE